MNDDMAMDLDLNLEPTPADSVVGLGSLLNDLESTHSRIEDRIRQLEAVTARARQRQRWRLARNNPDSSTYTIESLVNLRSEGNLYNREDVGAQESSVERGKGCKRDSSYLVAKALEMDSNVKRPVNSDGGSFYDCNICLDMAKEPILTCCGHLFCWSCFYQLPFVDSTAKECPVCKGEVTNLSVTPIYGNGNNTRVPDLESGLMVPPRPQARRVESVRQQRVNRGISHIPVAEALRRIRIGIGATGDQPRQQDPDSVSANFETGPHLLLNAETGGSRRLRSRHFSRVLSESSASLSLISSALNNAERLVEDLETHIQDRAWRRGDSQILPIDGGDPLPSNDVSMQPEHQILDLTTELIRFVPLPSTGTTDISAAVHVDNLTSDTAVNINMTVPRPLFSRRRSVSRASDVDNGVPRERRRRRPR
ncbi:hypothetical protein RJ639_008541 [Escallonia herrerae]|uniref:E3 ubiquitin-protein ligase RMA n=1 Tax=Escallonia herrerae TaxID=1293975 RepID=A0AA89AUF2_9ASTE|nr:hypothetical protein RJ639_008541 [Escallonia herrerae]